MRPDGSIPFSASIELYQQAAQALFDALRSGDSDAQWRFKWEHPRFRGQSVDNVQAASLELADAQTVIAREHGFENWGTLETFAREVPDDGLVAWFENAVEAIISGNISRLQSLLRDHPELVRARSSRRHHATLLHYLAANGVEGERQITPSNALEMTKLLLDAGAEVDALADMYDQKCTTMSMLVSSYHPAAAGLQSILAETLLDYGAALEEGPGTKWQSSLMTALAFGYLDTAKTLARRGARINRLTAAAGLGLREQTVQMLEGASADERHVALALAAQHGHAEIVGLLLDAGEDCNRLNPEGYHSHSTPLHQAVCANQGKVVRLLVERGARLDVRDTLYKGTPLDWAIHEQKSEIADYLRKQEAQRDLAES